MAGRGLLGLAVVLAALFASARPAAAQDPQGWNLLEPCWPHLDGRAEPQCSYNWLNIRTNEFVPVTTNISAFAGKAVAVRWRFRVEDRACDGLGPMIDEIELGPTVTIRTGPDGAPLERYVLRSGADTDAERGLLLTMNNRGPDIPGWYAHRLGHHEEWAWRFADSTGGLPNPGTRCTYSGSLTTPVVKLTDGPQHLRFQINFPSGLFDGREDAFMAVEIAVDTDEDGLLDRWELDQGVDLDDDGAVRLDERILPGAHPGIKDLFLEIDCMKGPNEGERFCASSEALDLVRDAFAWVPVTNPSGIPGIRFHADVSPPEQDLGHRLDVQFGREFEALKRLTPGRECCYHYALFADSEWDTTALGMAELGGNDVLITLGAMKAWNLPISPAREASTLFHELGHNLNLRHGGSDHSSYKPNYQSVMNYAYETLGFRFGLARTLSYSYETLPTLLETCGSAVQLDEFSRCLDELAGLPEASYRIRRQCFRPPGEHEVESDPARPIDWNCNGQDDLRVWADVDGDGDRNGVLVGHNDLDTMSLVFGDTVCNGFAQTTLCLSAPAMRVPQLLRLTNHPGADLDPPSVTTEGGLTGPNGRQAARVAVADVGWSGVQRVVVEGPNVETADLTFPELPATTSAEILVEATDGAEPDFRVRAFDWADNVRALRHGEVPDLLSPTCALVANMHGDVRLHLSDDRGLESYGLLPLANARYTGRLPAERNGVVLRFATEGPGPFAVGARASDAAHTTTCTFDQEAAVADADGDDVSDSLDNCPALANPDQQDDDGDGVGNACGGVAVPLLSGRAEPAAQSLLASSGLALGRRLHRHHASVAAGIVVAQDPAPATRVPAGRAVDLVVSLGPSVVPSVVGLAEDAAAAALAEAGLEAGGRTRVFDPAVTAGRVISQGIGAGTVVPPGSRVDFVVSLGPRTVSVPDLAGRTQPEAEAALAAVGLAAGSVTTDHSLSVPIGRVIRQTPAAGATAPENSAVAFVLSLGPRSVAVPQLAGMPQAQAGFLLESLGLALGDVSYAHSVTVAQDRVLGHDPAAGATVPEGTAVSLVVSLGPVMTIVPDVTGLTQDAATLALAAAGLAGGPVLLVDSTVAPGLVAAQIPIFNSQLPEGSSVALHVSRGNVMLTVGKTAPASVQRGEGFRYLLSYANAGSRETPDTVVRDTLPASVVFRSAGQGGQYDPVERTVTWALGTLPPGGSGQLSLDVAATCTGASIATNFDYRITSVDGAFQGPSVLTSLTPASAGPVSVTLASLPERLPLRPGDRVVHTVTLVNPDAQRRPDVRFVIGAGAAMDLASVVQDGGGRFRQLHPADTWEWTGSLGPQATVQVVVETRVERTIPFGVEGTAANFGLPLQVQSACGAALGATPPPAALALLRPVVTTLEVVAQSGPQAGRDSLLVRPGAPLDVTLRLASQSELPQDVQVQLALPEGLQAASDSPFVSPADPGAAYDPVTRVVSWQGSLAPGAVRTVTLRADVAAGAPCRFRLGASGSTTGADVDTGASRWTYVVPEPPAEAHLVGLDAQAGLWTFRPGLDAAQRPLFCPIAETMFGLGRSAEGTLYVSGLPSFRLDPARLELEFLPQQAFTDVATDTTTDPPSTLFASPDGLWRRHADGTTTSIVEDPTLGLAQLLVDPEGRILGRRSQDLLRVDPRTGGHEVIAVDVHLPFADQLGTPLFRGLSHVGLAADGAYLLHLSHWFLHRAGPGQLFHVVDFLASVDRDSLAIRIVADTLAVYSFDLAGQPVPPPAFLSPLLPMNLTVSAMAADRDGRLYFGNAIGALAALRTTPATAGETLLAAADVGAVALEWVAAGDANRPPTPAAGGPYVVDEGSLLRLDGSASTDPDGDAITGTWTFRGTPLPGVVAQIAANDDFTGDAVLVVADARGLRASATAGVVVRNVAPTADAGPDRQAYWGVAVTLPVSVQDPGPADRAAGFAVTWNFGDGSSANVADAVHAYASAGSYTATVSAADKDGGVGQDHVGIQVARRPTRLEFVGPQKVVFGLSAKLTARLVDEVDSVSARLEQRTVAFTLGPMTLTGQTDAAGLVTVAVPWHVATKHPQLTAAFAEDADYLGSSASATLSAANSPGCVVSESITTDQGTASFRVSAEEGFAPTGELRFSGPGGELVAATITGLGIDGSRAWIGGVTADGRRFTAWVQMASEWAPAQFKLQIEPEPKATGGPVTSGHVTIGSGTPCP